jgi:hypothetical protein
VRADLGAGALVGDAVRVQSSSAVAGEFQDVSDRPWWNCAEDDVAEVVAHAGFIDLLAN